LILNIYLTTDGVELEWFVDRWNNNYNFIFDSLKEVFSQTKRQKQLAEMIWKYIMTQDVNDQDIHHPKN
jgi:hypothetical protein